MLLNNDERYMTVRQGINILVNSKLNKFKRRFLDKWEKLLILLKLNQR